MSLLQRYFNATAGYSLPTLSSHFVLSCTSQRLPLAILAHAARYLLHSGVKGLFPNTKLVRPQFRLLLLFYLIHLLRSFYT